MKKTKIIMLSLFILISLILPLLSISACSKPDGGSGEIENNNNDSQGDLPDSNEAGEDATEEPFPEPDVPEKDFKGVDFNVLYPFWGAFETQLFGDEETSAGTELDDAIWKRNKKIEDQVNIKFNTTVLGQRGEDTIKKIMPAVKKSVMAGDGSYDLVFIHPMCDLNAFASSQLIRNWNKMPYVDLSKPYWNQSLSDTLAINNILLFAANDMIIPSPTAIFFNKKILQEYNMDNPYEFVRNGTWTWDKFLQMAKQVTKDLNGDGIYDKNDLYGLGILLDGSGMIAMMHSCDQYITKRNEDGKPELDIMSDKLISLIDKIYDIVWNGNQTYTWDLSVWDSIESREEMDNFFPQGHSLFRINSPGTGASKELRAMEVDFGILPYPKYNEAQKDYISLNHAGLMCVPQDVKDVDMVGIVCELLGAESLRYTIPAYFDVLLTHKGVRDDDSLEMMKIIFDNVVYDFGYNYSNFTNMAYIVPRIIEQKSTDVASFYERNSGVAQKDLDSAYKNIIKYEDLDF
ncbi:MAG: extracellular solute-binding protein [Oscillospiraceae bacterium]|nr:extracellular solute-binding protein [Oscillospiraceae bacterium]